MTLLAVRAGWLRHLAIAVSQQHHRELVPVFRPYIPPDAVVLDVGAHAGQFAKLFAAMAPQGQVHAFEPSAYARSVLKPALSLARARHVQVHAFGLSDTPGTLTLHTPIKRGGDMGFGIAHLGPPTAGAVDQTVELRTLDEFAADAGLARLDFIKADIEGWEAHMLKGGLATLRRFKPAVFLEVSQPHLARAGSSPEQVWDLLAPIGYRALKAPGFEPVDGFSGDGDYLFVAKG
jgi:FkbM family methyltransferase